MGLNLGSFDLGFVRMRVGVIALDHSEICFSQSTLIRHRILSQFGRKGSLLLRYFLIASDPSLGFIAHIARIDFAVAYLKCMVLQGASTCCPCPAEKTHDGTAK